MAPSSGQYDREPQSWTDGIPVFLPEAQVRALDEYAEGDPYRDEYTPDSTWDRFRVATLLEETLGDRVLEVGCGSGALTTSLAERHELAACDVSLTAVRRLSERMPSVDLAVADAMDLPYARDQFDCVVAANLFEHLESPSAFLRSVDRCLRPGGRLVMSTPARYRTRNARRILTGREVQLNSPHHVTEYTVGQVKELLRWSGYELVKTTSNLTCQTRLGTVAAHGMQTLARLVGSHEVFGDPTVYVAERRSSPKT